MPCAKQTHEKQKCRGLAGFLSAPVSMVSYKVFFPWGFLKPVVLAAGRGRNHSVFLQGSVHVYGSTFLLNFLLACDLLSLEIHPAADLHTPQSSLC